MYNKLIRKVKSLLSPSIQWKGLYNTWEEAAAISTGYDQQVILDHVIASTKAAKAQEGWFERDGFLIKEHTINPMLLSGLYYAGLSVDQNKSFDVLDFGGALGSVFHQHQKQLQVISQLRWHVLEQDHFIQAGKDMFGSGQLRFHETVEAYKKEVENTGVLLFSSVLQYLEVPYQWLENLIATNPQFIVIDLSVISEDLVDEDLLTIQYLPAGLYGQPISYPCWLFGQKLLSTLYELGYTQVMRNKAYIGSVKHSGRVYPYQFVLFEKSQA